MMGADTTDGTGAIDGMGAVRTRRTWAPAGSGGNAVKRHKVAARDRVTCRIGPILSRTGGETDGPSGPFRGAKGPGIKQIKRLTPPRGRAREML